ncbi:hypothetical protein AB0D16_40510, partial [Streptomyces sp. NPDC048161]
MTITTETGPGSMVSPDVSTATGTVSATGPDVSTDGLAGWLDGSGDTTAEPGGAPQGSSRLRWWLGLAFLVGGLAVGGIGFYLSFDNLSAAANTRFAFSPGTNSVLFALGVDVTIAVCLVGDLLFAA